MLDDELMQGGSQANDDSAGYQSEDDQETEEDYEEDEEEYEDEDEEEEDEE